jgi:RNA polymerase sigma-70 factor (ECF subfamily)
LQKQDQEKQFEQQVTAHKGLLYKICRIYAATEADRDDLFQEIVIQLWKAYPGYKGTAQFSTWMYRVALNTAITGIRKKKISSAHMSL